MNEICRSFLFAIIKKPTLIYMFIFCMHVMYLAYLRLSIFQIDLNDFKWVNLY